MTTIIVVNIQIIYKIITKLSLPAPLEALCLHLIGSSQELTHTEKHSTGKTRKCAKNYHENFLQNKIILFTPKCNCRSKFCKEEKCVKGFRYHLCAMSVLTPLDNFENRVVNLGAIPRSAKHTNKETSLIWRNISSSLKICYWFMKTRFNLSPRGFIFSFRWLLSVRCI